MNASKIFKSKTFKIAILVIVFAIFFVSIINNYSAYKSGFRYSDLNNSFKVSFNDLSTSAELFDSVAREPNVARVNRAAGVIYFQNISNLDEIFSKAEYSDLKIVISNEIVNDTSVLNDFLTVILIIIVTSIIFSFFYVIRLNKSATWQNTKNYFKLLILSNTLYIFLATGLLATVSNVYSIKSVDIVGIILNLVLLNAVFIYTFNIVIKQTADNTFSLKMLSTYKTLIKYSVVIFPIISLGMGIPFVMSALLIVLETVLGYIAILVSFSWPKYERILELLKAKSEKILSLRKKKTSKAISVDNATPFSKPKKKKSKARKTEKAKKAKKR